MVSLVLTWPRAYPGTNHGGQELVTPWFGFEPQIPLWDQGLGLTPGEAHKLRTGGEVALVQFSEEETDRL